MTSRGQEKLAHSACQECGVLGVPGRCPVCPPGQALSSKRKRRAAGSAASALAAIGVSVLILLVVPLPLDFPARIDAAALELTARYATAGELDDYTGSGDSDVSSVQLVVELRNNSQQPLTSVTVAASDDVGLRAAELNAPNWSTPQMLADLLQPASQIVSSRGGWDVGTLSPDDAATLYLAVEPPVARGVIRAAAAELDPVVLNLDGPALLSAEPHPDNLSSPSVRQEDHPSDLPDAESDARPRSSDGIDWQRVNNDQAVFGGDGRQEMWSVLAAGPGLVAVGRDGERDDAVAAVWTSVDGRSWQRLDNDESVFGGDGRQEMYAVTEGGPGLVAVGRDTGRDVAAVWTSADGLAWRRVSPAGSLFGHAGTVMRSVAGGGPGLVAVGRDWARGSGAVWTSADGLDWQRFVDDEAVFDAQDVYSVTVGGPGLVAVGQDFGRDAAAVWTSTDGSAWRRVAHDEAIFGGDGAQFMTSVAAGGPGLVAVGWDFGRAAAAVWLSTDGIEWWRVEHDELVFGGGTGMGSVSVGGPGLVAVGVDWRLGEVRAWASSDGIEWQLIIDENSEFGRGEMLSVTAGGPGLVAVGYDRESDSAAVWTSP